MYFVVLSIMNYDGWLHDIQTILDYLPKISNHNQKKIHLVNY